MSVTSYALNSDSIPKSFYPRLTWKSPCMPQWVPYEFLTIQYGVLVLSSCPQPTR